MSKSESNFQTMSIPISEDITKQISNLTHLQGYALFDDIEYYVQNRDKFPKGQNLVSECPILAEFYRDSSAQDLDFYCFVALGAFLTHTLRIMEMLDPARKNTEEEA